MGNGSLEPPGAWASPGCFVWPLFVWDTCPAALAPPCLVFTLPRAPCRLRSEEILLARGLAGLNSSSRPRRPGEAFLQLLALQGDRALLLPLFLSQPDSPRRSPARLCRNCLIRSRKAPAGTRTYKGFAIYGLSVRGASGNLPWLERQGGGGKPRKENSGDRAAEARAKGRARREPKKAPGR